MVPDGVHQHGTRVHVGQSRPPSLVAECNAARNLAQSPSVHVESAMKRFSGTVGDGGKMYGGLRLQWSAAFLPPPPPPPALCPGTVLVFPWTKMCFLTDLCGRMSVVQGSVRVQI